MRRRASKVRPITTAKLIGRRGMKRELTRRGRRISCKILLPAGLSALRRLEKVRDGGDQGVNVDWLREVSRETCSGAALDVRSAAKAGHRDSFDAVTGRKFSHEVASVAIGQLQVAEEDIEADRFRRRQRVGTRGNGMHLAATPPQ